MADLACGSGHILNECFDLLYKIYVEEGYSRSQAIKSILRKNLLGIDLDTRAKQLATFALLMKACQKDSAFLYGRIMPRVYDMPRPIAEAIAAEGDTRTAEEYLRETLPHYLLGGNDEMVKELTAAILLMNHADTLGSIMKFDIAEQTRNAVMVRTEEYEEQLANGEIVPGAIQLLMPYMRIILALTEKYAALCMNPPYMGSGRFDEVLGKYVKDNYEEGKSDLFSVFMLMGMERLAPNGKMAQINMQSWMFLSSFEKLRTKFLEHYNIDSMLHLGPRTFDELSDEVVQNTAFVVSKHLPTNEGGVYYRLVEGKNCADKEQLFLSHIHGNEDGNRIYYPNVAQKNFEKIPGGPIGYWVSEKVRNNFSKGEKLSDIVIPSVGIQTGDNDKFMHLWYEVNRNNIDLCPLNIDSTINGKKWYPFNKGGAFRKWYGNNEYIVNWKNDGQDVKKNSELTGHHYQQYDDSLKFRPMVTWSRIASNKTSFRIKKGFLFDMSGFCLYPIDNNRIETIGGFLNTNVARKYLQLVAPTLNFMIGPVTSLPFIEINVSSLVKDCVSISKLDWDAHETSWDFEQNPLVALAQRVGGAVSHRTNEELCADVGGAVSHCTNDANEELGADVGGAVSHYATEGSNSSNESQWCGETPHLLMADLVAQYEEEWTEKFMQLHANEEELNRQFINIYGLEDELTPDVPLSEITILQQGEVTIEKDV